MDPNLFQKRGGSTYLMLCSSTTFVGNMPSTNYSFIMPMIGLKTNGILAQMEYLKFME